MVVVLSALVGCSAPQQQTEKPPPTGAVTPGGTLVYATAQRLTGFNQYTQASASLGLYNVMVQVWPSAFRLGPDGRPVLNGDLLESAELTGMAPQTVVYKLNPAAVWSDGDPLDGRDFVYLWRTAYTSGARDIDGSPIATTTGSPHGAIQSVTSSDDQKTVTVVFARTYPDWKTLFSLLVPSHVAERVGWNHGFDKFDPSVVVSGGPFRIASYRQDQDLTLVRNERYWGTPAHLESIVIRLLPDGSQLLAAVKNREIDLAELINPTFDAVQQARGVPGLNTITYGQARYSRIYFNFRNELLAMPVVRRAIGLAVDRPAIVARFTGQLDQKNGTLANHRLYAPLEPEYGDVSAGRYDRGDPEGAMRLLEDAGFRRAADGFYARGDKRLSFRLIGAGPMSLLLQAQLNRVGIELAVVGGNPLESFQRGDFDLGASTRPTAPGAKAGEMVQFLTGGSFNPGGYSNPVVDDLIRQANSELDDAKRISLHHRIDELMWDDLPTLPIEQAVGVIVYRDTFTNIVPSISGGLFEGADKWGRRAPR